MRPPSSKRAPKRRRRVVQVEKDVPNSRDGNQSTTDEDTNATQAAVDDYHSSLTLYRAPWCEQMQLAYASGKYLSTIYVTHTTAHFIPPRIGHNVTLDAAAEAVIHAMAFRAGDASKEPLALKSYVLALQSLQKSVALENPSELHDLIIICGMLSTYEHMMRTSMARFTAHCTAVRNLVLSRGVKGQESAPVVRMALYANHRYLDPVVEGVVHPYDAERWLRVPPPEGSSTEGNQLVFAAHKLNIRIPRLVLGLRRLRNTTEPTQKDIFSIVELANELLSVYDSVVDSRLLHLVNVRKVDDAFQKTIAPVSLSYKSIAECEASTNFWHVYVLLQRLCLELHDLLPIGRKPPFEKSALCEGMSRMIRNYLMSLPYISTHGFCGAYYIHQGILSLWCAVRGTHSLPGVEASTVRKWCLRYSPEFAGVEHSEASTIRELDSLSDVLLGGPIAVEEAG